MTKEKRQKNDEVEQAAEQFAGILILQIQMQQMEKGHRKSEKIQGNGKQSKKRN